MALPASAFHCQTCSTNFSRPNWARVSPRYRHLAEGIELADSWATDGHKWLQTPYDCGYAIVRDGAIIPSPTPAEPLRAGDVIVAVGTREGLDGVARLLANGPD